MKLKLLPALGITLSALTLSVRADITTGLVGYWTLDEGSGALAADSSGSNNAGTLSGFADTTFTTMWTTNAWLTNAIAFNQSGETSDYVSVADAPSLDVSGTKQFTLAAWVNLSVSATGSGGQNGGRIITKGAGNREAYYMTVGDTGNKFSVVMRNSGGSSTMAVTNTTAPTKGLWYHVVGTYNTATTPKMNIYINGVWNNQSYGSLTTVLSTNRPLTIGNRDNGLGTYNLPFKGTIDEVRVYNRCLSAGDVFELYTNNGRLPVITAQPRSVNCYSNDTAVFTVKVDGSKALVPFGYQWQWNGANIAGATSSSLTLANVTTANAGTYSVLLTNYLGSLTSSNVLLTVSDLPAVNTTSGLVGWWKFDEASGAATAADSSGNGHPGTLNGFLDTSYTSMWGEGLIDGALFFNADGAGSNVVAVPALDTPAPAVLDFAASPVFSLSAWVNGATVQTNGAAIIAKGAGGGGEQYVLEVNSGNYRLLVRDTNGVVYTAQTTLPPTGFWQHLAAVCDAPNGLLAVYVNGLLAASGVAPYSLQANSHEVSIGARQPSTNLYNNVFTGAIDDVRVYNRGLTAADVFAIYSDQATPIITAQYPVTYTNLYTLYAGSSPAFRIATVTGLQPFAYQWYLNGVADPVGTNATYQLVNLPQGSITNYCVVSNPLGSVTSFVWTATVVAHPTAPYPRYVLGLNPVGYWRLDEADNSLGDGNPGVVAHDYIGGNNGVYTNVWLGTAGYGQGLASQYGYYLPLDPETAPQLGSYAAANSYAGAIQGVDFGATNGSTANFSVECWVSGNGAQSSAATILSKGIYALNDAWSFSVDTTTARKYRFSVRTADGTVLTATSKLGADVSVWHHLVGVLDETHGAVTFYIDGTNAATTTVGTTAGAYNSSANLLTIGSAQNNTKTGPYSLQFNGFVNDVAVYNYSLSASQVQSNYLVAGIGARVTQAPPAKATVTEPGTLIASAAVYGSPDVGCYWVDNYGSPLMANQTNTTLVLSNVTSELDGDGFYLYATNQYGSGAVAGPLVLTVVWGPPQLTLVAMPAQVTVPLGKSYTYTVSATGTVPFSYQWYDGGSLVPNQTNASYSAPAPTLGSRTIRVTVSNTRGSTNASSVLTVVAPPTDPYATNLLALSPVGYWPLQETTPPAPVTMETNLGTLGRLGNAYYALNATTKGTMKLNQNGALTPSGDNDPAVAFKSPSAANYVFVPHSIPELSIRPPFTVEAWINSSDTGFADILGQGGNGNNCPVNSGDAGGFRLSYSGGNTPGAADLSLYLYTGSGTTRPFVGSTNAPMTFGFWHHCVATFDGTNALVYVDGQGQNSKTMTMAVDTWSPLTIGDGMWMNASTGPNRAFTGSIDEVAVYTNVLSPDRILAHYTAANNTTGSNYVAAVQYDSPLLYYRMDAAAFIAQNVNLCPQALNYGSAGGSGGTYQAGITPGAVAGLPLPGLSPSVAAPINGVISCVDAGNDPAFNMTDGQAFSALVWFKGNPADARDQALLSHGTNWALHLDGTTGKLQFTPNNTTILTTPNIVNDGNWHLAAGVYDGTTVSLYLDGGLSVSHSATGSVAGDPNADVFIGGNADYTSVGGNQMFFDGALAQAAVFNTALTESQLQSLYNLVYPAPTISIGYSGGNVVVTYNGTLLSSTNVSGTFTPVTGATSPYTVPQGDGQRFYRARIP